MKISPLLTFNILYWHRLFFSVILYWNYIPFFIYLLAIGGEFLGRSNSSIGLFTNLAAVLLTVLFQLYQWSFAFFTAQDVSDGKVGIPDYNINDLFSDWGVKLKLLIIRLFYLLPLIIIGGFFSITNIGDLVNSLGSINGASSLFAAASILTFGSLFFLLALIIENTFITAANYQYSYSNSLLSAFNLVAVTRFVIRNIVDLTGLVFINLLFYFAFLAALSFMIFLLAIPFVGAIILSIMIGFFTSWHVLYIPTLQGQIWGNYHRRQTN